RRIRSVGKVLCRGQDRHRSFRERESADHSRHPGHAHHHHLQGVLIIQPMGAAMKIVEITPREKSPIYGGLVKREAAIRKNGRGTFSRRGPARSGAATWSHKRFKGSVSLKRERAELVTAKIRSGTPEDEG